MGKKALRILSATMLFLILFTGSVLAQDPTPSDDEVNAIARKLYCPVCENVPLDVCPTQACAQWRGVIYDKLAEGWTEEQIQDYFVAQYGMRVLETPRAEGLNLLVYILPPVAFAISALILFRAIRSWRKKPEPEMMTVQDDRSVSEDPYVARVEEELRQRE